MRLAKTVFLSLATIFAVVAVGTSEVHAQCPIGSLNFISLSSTTFSWTAPGGGCPASYDVAYGAFPPWPVGDPFLLPPLDLTFAACLADNIGATTASDAFVMPVGTGRWYLVRANNPFAPPNTWNETSVTQVFGRDSGALFPTCPF